MYFFACFPFQSFYCAFVDMKKASDKIYRNTLWLKLFEMGIAGKMFRIIKWVYE